MRDPDGARQELADLWQRQYDKLLSQCLYWTGGRRDLAEEALARSTAVALEKYPEHADRLRHPAAWLRRITYHACVDLHREMKRRGEDDLDDLDEGAPALQTKIGAPQDPEQAYLRREGRGALHAGILRLPDRLRRPVELFLDHELSYREIADALSITEANVRKRMQHAREALKPLLERYREGCWELGLPSRHSGVREPVPDPGSGAPGPRVNAMDNGLPRGLGPEPVTAVRIFPVRRFGGTWKDVTHFFREPLQPASPRRFQRLESYIRDHPGGWKRRREAARLLRQEGRWAEAVPHYRFALAKQPRQPALWAELGDLLRTLGAGDQALDCYRSARRRARTGVARRRWRASMLTTEGQLPEAVEILRDALAVAPRCVLLQVEIGWLLLQTHRFSEAEEASRRLLKELPGDGEALVLSHDARFAAGDPSGAVRQIERALTASIDNPPALVRWLVHQTLERIPSDPERARIYRRRLRELAPDWADRRYVEALGLEISERREGKEGRGFREMEGWLEVRGPHPRGHLLLARLLDRLGASEEAMRARARGTVVDPEDRVADWL